MTLATAAELVGILGVGGTFVVWLSRLWRGHRPTQWFRKRMVLIVLPERCFWGSHVPSGSSWLQARFHVGNVHLGDDFARAYLWRPRAEGSPHWITEDQIELSVTLLAKLTTEPGNVVRSRLVLIDNQNRQYTVRVPFKWVSG